MLIAFFACMGFEQPAVVAGEARHPHRDLPAGILGGVAGVGVLYTLLMLVCFQTVPDLAHARRPLADAAAALVGPHGATVVSLAAVLSCAGTLSVWMIVSPRVLYALAGQGDMPRVFATVDPVRHIPAVAIMSSAIARVDPDRVRNLRVPGDVRGHGSTADVRVNLRRAHCLAQARRPRADPRCFRTPLGRACPRVLPRRARNHDRDGDPRHVDRDRAGLGGANGGETLDQARRRGVVK